MFSKRKVQDHVPAKNVVRMYFPKTTDLTQLYNLLDTVNAVPLSINHYKLWAFIQSKFPEEDIGVCALRYANYINPYLEKEV